MNLTLHQIVNPWVTGIVLKWPSQVLLNIINKGFTPFFICTALHPETKILVLWDETGTKNIALWKELRCSSSTPQFGSCVSMQWKGTTCHGTIEHIDAYLPQLHGSLHGNLRASAGGEQPTTITFFTFTFQFTNASSISTLSHFHHVS